MAKKPRHVNQQVPPPEVRYATELAKLAAEPGPRPPGWRLTPSAVVAFVCGDERLEISRKFVGDVSLVERCVITLAEAVAISGAFPVRLARLCRAPWTWPLSVGWLHRHVAS